MNRARDRPGEVARALPPGWRTLEFKYPAGCGAGCGVDVQRGERGFWNPDTKEVRHASCPPSADTKAGRERSPWTGLPDPKNDWQRLVAYCRACVLREALAEPARYEDFGTVWAVVPAGPERIFAGVSRSLIVSQPLSRVIAAGPTANVSGQTGAAPTQGAATAGGRQPRQAPPPGQTRSDAPAADGDEAAASDELAYGWPLVVCRDGAGAVRCAPLLIAGVASPAAGARNLAVDVDSTHLNLAVADPRFQPDADPTELRLIAEEPLALGDPDALAEQLTAIAQEAGLTVREPLDARALLDGRPPAVPGVYNRAVVLRREASKTTVNLQRDLKDLFFAGRTDWAKTAAASLVGSQVSSQSRPVPVVSTTPLNSSQEAAVLRALSSRVSVVTGPPGTGTGKSQFVAALVATARDQDLTVLVASTNNGAVDEAVERASAAHPATILRTGNAAYRKELIVTLDAICSDAAEGSDRGETRASHRAMSVRREHARAALDARAQDLRRLDETASTVSRLADLLWSGEPPASIGEDAALVLRRIAGARRWWRRRARRQLLSDLSLATRRDIATALDDACRWAQGALELHRAHEGWAVVATASEWEQWQETQDAWQQSGRALVAATSQAAIHAAGERLDRLLAAYRGDNGKGRALLEFLDVLPAWGTSALSVRPSFACEPAIFDLVVIDEASQCTLQAVLPLAFRAKQIVIVGDPNQLPPVVTLPSDELEQLPGCAGLDAHELRERRRFFGDDSSYTAFRALVDDELLLDEHYRCHPDIAAFCDEQFYSGRLHVLTNTKRDNAPPVTGLSWTQVAGTAAPGATGGRINKNEVDSIADWVIEHAPALRASGSSLGVVTPFTAQARLLRTRLDRAIDRGTREQLRLRVGTAHTFQGAEREVMLFSTVVADGVPDGTIGWLEKNRCFSRLSGIIGGVG